MLEGGGTAKVASDYDHIESCCRPKNKTIGLILAGNIPLVGFHDMMCVLATGHRVLAKPSSKDDRLSGVLSES